MYTMYKFIGAGTTEPINESCSYDKLSLHWPAPKAALAANTKNEFYISTFAIICIIYDVLGNVVKLRPLKTLRVCVGHPSAVAGRWRWKVKTLGRELEETPTKQLCLSAGPQIFMRLTGIRKHSGS